MGNSDAARFEAVARLPEIEARRLADELSETEAELFPAVSCFEDGDSWEVRVHFAERAAAEPALAAAGRRRLGREVAFAVSAIPDLDWVRRSLEGLKPVVAGRLVVHGGHDRDNVPPHALGIEIEAATAFGTGHHATTLGCLMALDDLARRGPRRYAVLDVGTGTGVLAIAAARLWRVPALAGDIDPGSVRVARDNARLNRAGPLVRALTASGTHHGAIESGAPYDLIFANILAGPLVALAPDLARLAARGGLVVLSGLLTAQERRVLAAYRAHGLAPVRRIRIGEWSTLVLAPLAHGRAAG